MSNADKKWLAAYLYYNEPWEEFLSKAVKPFIEDIMNNNLAEQFFFIRYWEQGPHIRLRFKGDPTLLDEQIKPKLISHFNDYFKENPSKREDSDWVKNLPEDRQWFPNNTIQFIDYEPEVTRYGGEDGILIAEEQFQFSSKAILAILEESDEWDYNRALGAAIQLHLGFIYALDMNVDEAYKFFERVFHNWLPRAYYSYEGALSQEELEKRKAETLEAFQQNFESQKEVLESFVKQIWEAFNDQQEFEQDWLNDWLDNMNVTGKKLRKAQLEGKLIPPEWYKINNTNRVAKENQQRWAIYDSYVHMINNRLGILNRDEGYLGYLIKESLKSLA